MAGENLKAFENLRETTANSLNDQEKKALNQIDAKDFRQSKDKIGQKKFTIDGNPMALKDIVKNLKFDSTGQRATLNGKQLAWKSELGAAIQVYAIANNKDVGFAGIDGKVGRGTIDGLQSTQNVIKAEKNQGRKNPETQVPLIGVAEIATKSFTKYITPASNIKRFEDLGILDSKTGVLKPYNKTTYVNDNKLVFKYKFKEKNVTLNIPLKLDSNHELNPKDLASRIIKEAVKQEGIVKTDVKQESIVDAVESFDVTGKFSKKAMAYLKEKDFLSASGKHLDFQIAGTGIYFDNRGNLHFKDAFYISKDKINSCYVNGKLNESKFSAILSPYFDTKANEHFRSKAHKLAQNLNKYRVTVGSIGTVSQQIDYTEREMKKIGGLVQISPEDSKILSKKKEELRNMKDFNVVSKGMENTLKDLVKNWKDSMGTEDYATSVDALRRFSRHLNEHKRAWEGKSVYTVYSKIPDGQNKYEDLKKRAQDAADKTRQKEK